MNKQKTFLIAPVRGYDANAWQAVVSELELKYDVWWPARDTLQYDDTGLRICRDNRAAIEASDVVHLIWDAHSTGCLFDMGMAFALRKPIIILSLPEDHGGGKSFLKMPRAWEQYGAE